MIDRILRVNDKYVRQMGYKGLLLGLRRRLLPWPIAFNSLHAGKIYLRVGSSDFYNYQMIFEQREYELPYPENVETIVDAGAYIGLSALYYHQRYPKARIISLEPDLANFSVLTRNVAHIPNITPLNMALWSEDTKLCMDDPGLDEWALRTSPSANDSQNLVSAISLDSLIRAHRIKQVDILKVDIESAEKEVFADPSAWVERVRSVAIELHDRYLEGCTEVVDKALSDFPYRETRGENTFYRREVQHQSETRSMVKTGP
jgi:FkbM family methyltransferase